MWDQNGACTKQRGVFEQDLETFSWQLTVLPASRRCPASLDTHASIGRVLQHTLFKAWNLAGTILPRNGSILWRRQ